MNTNSFPLQLPGGTQSYLSVPLAAGVGWSSRAGADVTAAGLGTQKSRRSPVCVTRSHSPPGEPRNSRPPPGTDPPGTDPPAPARGSRPGSHRQARTLRPGRRKPARRQHGRAQLRRSHHGDREQPGPGRETPRTSHPRGAAGPAAPRSPQPSPVRPQGSLPVLPQGPRPLPGPAPRSRSRSPPSAAISPAALQATSGRGAPAKRPRRGPGASPHCARRGTRDGAECSAETRRAAAPTRGETKR